MGSSSSSREEEGREGGIGIPSGRGEGRLFRPSSRWMEQGASRVEGVREEEEEGGRKEVVGMVLLLALVLVLLCVGLGRRLAPVLP